MTATQSSIRQANKTLSDPKDSFETSTEAIFFVSTELTVATEIVTLAEQPSSLLNEPSTISQTSEEPVNTTESPIENPNKTFSNKKESFKFSRESMLIAQTQPTFSLKPVTLEKQLSSPLSQSFAVPEDSKDALTTTEPSTEGPNTSSSDINFLFDTSILSTLETELTTNAGTSFTDSATILGDYTSIFNDDRTKKYNC